MDNQNNQNGYNNFNGYQPTPDPTQQPYQTPDPAQQQNPYAQQQPYAQQYQQPYQTPDPTQQMPYAAQQNPYAQAPADNSKTLGILSIVFSSVSLFCCGFIFGAVGIILGILCATKNKKSPLGWIGIGIGVLSIILAIVSMVTMGPVYNEMIENIMNQMN